MNELIEDIKQEKEFRSKLNEDYRMAVHSSAKEKDVLLKTIYPRNKLLEEAVNLAGETIYYLETRNNVLEEEISSMNEFNEEKISKLVAIKKSEQDENKNKIILNALRRTKAKAKQLL